MRTRKLVRLCTLPLLLAACGTPEEETDLPRAGAADPAERSGAVTPLVRGGESLPIYELEEGRLDPTWRAYAERDRAGRGAAGSTPDSDTGGRAGRSGGPGAASGPAERWEEITPAAVTPQRVRVPVDGDVEGPSVLTVQILLDRVRFSPGILDGRWGKNTQKAVYWFQYTRGLPASGTVDRATLERLAAEGGGGDLVRRQRLSSEDVEGPFLDLPEDVYEKAELDCLCYESLREKLAELFHTTPDLLAQLNPDVDLDGVGSGSELVVPAVGGPLPEGRAPDVAQIVISDGGHYLHALDRTGRLLFHFPSTLGSEYAPSPSGDYRVTGVAFDPEWHYQPDLLEGEPDDAPDALLPAGPNSAVGVVWMSLSKEHYGIHGTSAPETIGYATSSGCVRLTNWDARFLAERVGAGVPVLFRDTDGGGS